MCRPRVCNNEGNVLYKQRQQQSHGCLQTEFAFRFNGETRAPLEGGMELEVKIQQDYKYKPHVEYYYPVL
jgi:hypothetical protein